MELGCQEKFLKHYANRVVVTWGTGGKEDRDTRSPPPLCPFYVAFHTFGGWPSAAGTFSFYGDSSSFLESWRTKVPKCVYAKRRGSLVQSPSNSWKATKTSTERMEVTSYPYSSFFSWKGLVKFNSSTRSECCQNGTSYPGDFTFYFSFRPLITWT